MQHDMLVYLEKWSLKSLDVGYGNKLFFLFLKECDLYVDINMRIKLIFLYHNMDLMSFLLRFLFFVLTVFIIFLI